MLDTIDSVRAGQCQDTRTQDTIRTRLGHVWDTIKALLKKSRVKKGFQKVSRQGALAGRPECNFRGS